MMKSLAAKIFFRLLLLAVLGAGVWLWFALSPVHHAPGVLIPHAPVQSRGDDPAPLSPPIGSGAAPYHLKRLAGFSIRGRVLSVERYHDAQAALAPMDLVLGWGAMSDSAVLSGLTVTQRNRDYTLRWKHTPPLPPAEAVKQSANLHLIPSDGEIASLLGQLKPGCLVDFQGSLVEAQPDRGGPVWRSSLVREDTGPQSGELFYITSARSFDGNRDRSVEEKQRRSPETQDNLQRWFEALQRRRQTLDLRDFEAVRAYNLEAQRYMAAAHPKSPGSPTPDPGFTRP